MAKVSFVRLKKSKVKKPVEWRSFQSSKDSKKRLTLGFGALIALITLILLSRLAGFVTDFLEPLDRTAPLNNFSYNHQINLIVKAETIGLMSFDPINKTITVLKIPDEISLSLPFDFGDYPARSVFELGQSEKTPIGALLISLALSQNMGVPIDGYIISGVDKSLEDFVGGFRKDLLTAFKLDNSSVSSLSRYQILRLGLEIRGVRVDKVKFIDLERSELTEWKILPDKSRALIFNNLQLDRFLQINILDSEISNESLNVAVFNATDHPGLAIEAARQLTNIGVRVILTDAWEQKLNLTEVIGRPSYTKTRIKGLFSPKCGEVCDRIPEASTNQKLADVNLILGEDFYLRFHSKP